MSAFDVLPFPTERQLVVDAGYLASRRHIFYGLAEVDVTRARGALRARPAADGHRQSFTGYIVASLARAVEAHREVQAYRDWRGRLVLFHDVDVVTMVEPEPGAVAIPHIIRGANRKTFSEISEEIRSIQRRPERGVPQPGIGRLAPRVPRWVRLLFFWTVKKSPHWFRRLEGTVVVTSVGMFARGGLWGIGFLPTHTMGLTVGGISQKPGVHEGAISIRDYLNLTLAFDHDVVDGAPAARFGRTLVDLIESAAVLEGEIH